MYYELPKLAINFLDYLKVQDYPDITIRSYKQELSTFFKFIKQYKDYSIKISDIDENIIRKINIIDLNAFIADLSGRYNYNNQKYSSATKAKYISCLKSFYKYLAEQCNNLIMENPTKLLKFPRISRKIPEYLKEDEVDVLLNSIVDERDYAIITLFINCGLRVSELGSLKTQDISKDKNGTKIIIREGKGKKDRPIYLPPACTEAINKYINVRPECHIDNLFICKYDKGYKSISIAGIQKIVKKHVNLSQVNPKVHVHSLRHTFASLAVANGVDIKMLQEVLGHSDIKTTDRYIHNFSGNNSKVAILVNVGRK